MNKKERLNEAVNYLKYKGIVKKQEDIAKKMKASRTNVSCALSGNEKVLTDNFIARFCAAYTEISYTWLLLGAGDMLSNLGKTVNDRIKDVLKIESVSLETLGERFGKDFKILQECIDNNVEPNEEVIKIFCATLNINEEWIKTGTGEIYETDQYLVKKAALKKHMESLPTKPRLPKFMSEGHIEQYYGEGKKRMLCQEKPVVTQFSEYDFSLIMKNNRMSPKYDRGDELFFKKAIFPEWGNDFLLDTDDGPKFKRIYPDKDRDGDDCVRCVSYNKEEFPDFTIKEKYIHGYYRCVGVLRIL